MTKYSVELMPEAVDDLQAIYDYIAYDLKSEINASTQLERIETEIEKLEFLPNGFKPYEREPWHSRGLRMLPVDNYIIFYITDSETKTVYVLRIMYGRVDFSNHWK